MDLQTYLSFLKRRWLPLLSVTIVGVIASAGITLVVTPTYESTTQLFVSTSGSGSSSDLAQGNQFVQEQVQSYSNIATGNRVLQPVIDQLDLDETPARLAEQVSVQSPLNTVLISITVRDPEPRRAARIANAVGASLINVVTKLEQGSSGVGRSAVSLQTVESAQQPTSPVSPNLVTNVLIGLLAGLAVGLALSVVQEALDIAVRTEKDLQQLGLSSLAAMQFDPEAGKRPIIMIDAPQSARAESFRHLRTGVQFVLTAGSSNSLLITSASEGDGKTTTAVNLAIALASAGSTVALVDADLRRPMVGSYLGLMSELGLTSVLVGQVSLTEGLQTWGDDGQLHVLPAGLIPPNPSELLGSDVMRAVLRELEATHDVVVVDGAPVLPVTDSVVLSAYTGGSLLVVSSGRTKRPQISGAIAALGAVNARIVGAVLTMVNDRGDDRYGQYGYGYGYNQTQPTLSQNGKRRRG